MWNAIPITADAMMNMIGCRSFIFGTHLVMISTRTASTKHR